MPTNTLKAAKEFAKKEEEAGLLLFDPGSSINLARRLMERAFIEGASWALDRIYEDSVDRNTLG